MKFSTTVKDIFTTQEIRKRVLYTAFFATIYCLGHFIILPWIPPNLIIERLKAVGNKDRNFFDRALLTRFSYQCVFSLGIGPYITSSILIQMLSFVFSYFQRLEKEGRVGQSKLDTYTRWLTIPVAIAQSIVYLLVNKDVVKNTKWFYVTSIILLTSVALFSIWLADQITEKGLSNGSSVLIMVSTIMDFPRALHQEFRSKYDTNNLLFLLIEFIILFGIVLVVILFMRGVRKIMLQYARQMMSGHGSIAGSHQYLPIKLNTTGVMPIISASFMLGLLSSVTKFLGEKLEWSTLENISKVLAERFSWKYNAIQSLLIFVSTTMYVGLFINPLKIANELKRGNAFISGIQPGRPTANYIDEITTRVMIPGALFLVIICLLPAIAHNMIGVEKSFAEYYGRTSLLIIVSVFLDMTDQIKGHINMRYYDKMMRYAEKMPQL